MARSRRSAPAPRAAPRPAARPVSQAPPPATQHAAPAPAMHQPSSPGIMGGMMGMIGQGLAFGTGSAVAHRAVDAVMGPRTVQHEQVGGSAEGAAPAVSAAPQPAAPGQDACTWQSKAFQDCVQSNTSDISKCQFYVDMLNECKKNSASTL